MAEGTRIVEIRKDVEGLKEQLRTSSERTEKSIDELRSMIVAMAAHLNNSNLNGSGHGQSGEAGVESQTHRSHHPGNAGYQVPTKYSQIEFPKFNGEDLRGWVYKCEQFFEIDDTPVDAKVKLAAVHLEGKALQWHQVYMKARITREIPRWEEYVRALNDRFGTFLYEDPMSELVNLKQNGSIQEYMDKFDELLNCLELLETYAVSCFLGGLKADISIPVMMFKPKNMQEAINLARLQEQANAMGGRRIGEFQPSKPVTSSQNPTIYSCSNGTSNYMTSNAHAPATISPYFNSQQPGSTSKPVVQSRRLRT